MSQTAGRCPVASSRCWRWPGLPSQPVVILPRRGVDGAGAQIVDEISSSYIGCLNKVQLSPWWSQYVTLGRWRWPTTSTCSQGEVHLLRGDPANHDDDVFASTCPSAVYSSRRPRPVDMDLRSCAGRIDFSDARSTWNPGLEFSHLFNAFSILAPSLEPFLIKTMRPVQGAAAGSGHQRDVDSTREHRMHMIRSCSIALRPIERSVTVHGDLQHSEDGRVRPRDTPASAYGKTPRPSGTWQTPRRRARGVGRR